MNKFVILLVFVIFYANCKVYIQETFESRDSFEDEWKWLNTSKSDKSDRSVVNIGKVAPFDVEDLSNVLYISKKGTEGKFYKPLDIPIESFLDEDVVISYRVYKSSQACYASSIILGNDEHLLMDDKGAMSNHNLFIGAYSCHGRNFFIGSFGSDNAGSYIVLKSEKYTLPDITKKFHLISFIFKTDGSLTVEFDEKQIFSDQITSAFNYNVPETIESKEAKPSDWVDEEYIDNPEYIDTEGKEIQTTIVDTKNVKPDDWDESIDGEWKDTFIDNPEFIAKYGERRIKNPDYKGKWNPTIKNPKYIEDWWIPKGSKYVTIHIHSEDLNHAIDDLFIGDTEAHSEFVESHHRKYTKIENTLAANVKEEDRKRVLSMLSIEYKLQPHFSDVELY